MKATALLEKSRDPLGHGLWNYYSDNASDLITVYSDVTEPEYLNPGYFFRSFPEFPDLEKVAIQCCRGHTLDAGAGAGAHALALQKRNVPVTAIDVSEMAVEVMEKRGVRDARVTDFFELEAGHYDTLLMLMNGLGIAQDPEGLRQLLEKAKSLLKPGGQLIADSSDVAYLFEDEEELENWSRRMNRYYGQITYQMRYKGIESDPFHWLFVDYQTLKAIAQESGFECEMIHAGPHHQYLARLTI